MPPSADIRDAVRETVRLGRSQTQDQAAPQRAHNEARRSHSQDASPQQTDKKSKKPKKGSQHADVIDRLDFTGVGPMFHHDGPFDACAPSRNRQKSKAPMMAWTPRPEDELTESSGPYPSPNSYNHFSDTYDQPKKKVDAIAEAWGIHEPEPFEEFFAGGGARGDTPASSIYNGKDSHASRSNGKRAKEQRRDPAVRRSNVPPPQPIFAVDPASDLPDPSPPTPTSAPKRNKSIMQRIRKMRDAPNVPVATANYEEPVTPPARGEFARTEPFVYVDAKTNKSLPATPGLSDGDDPESSKELGAGGATLGRKTSLMKKVGKVVRGTR